jgi:hypothetical protein
MSLVADRRRNALTDAYQHWCNLGFSRETSMVLALAKHATDPVIRLGCIEYALRETNVRRSDLL